MKAINMTPVALVNDFTPAFPQANHFDRAILDARNKMDAAGGNYERFRNAQADYNEAVQVKRNTNC
jgi:hypothetical protein